MIISKEQADDFFSNVEKVIQRTIFCITFFYFLKIYLSKISKNEIKRLYICIKIVRFNNKFMYGIVRTLVNIVFGVIEFLLTLRFLFKFFVANASTPFVAWIYVTSASLVAPFARIFPDLNLGGFVVDFTTLVALVVYALVSYLILEVFSYTSTRYYRT